MEREFAHLNDIYHQLCGLKRNYSVLLDLTFVPLLNNINEQVDSIRKEFPFLKCGLQQIHDYARHAKENIFFLLPHQQSGTALSILSTLQSSLETINNSSIPIVTASEAKIDIEKLAKVVKTTMDYSKRLSDYKVDGIKQVEEFVKLYKVIELKFNTTKIQEGLTFLQDHYTNSNPIDTKLVNDKVTEISITLDILLKSANSSIASLDSANKLLDEL